MHNKNPRHASPFAIAAITLAMFAGLGTMVTASADDTAMPGAMPSSAIAARMDARVEQRITDLHTRLAITPAQEDSWSKVVQVMRDNESTMAALTKARADKAGTMTAIDDLNSYSEIASAHADGLRKFTPVFSALYDSMSDSQKANADTIFRAHAGKATKHMHTKVG